MEHKLELRSATIVSAKRAIEMNHRNAEKKVDALLRNPSVHLMDDLRWVVKQHLVDLFKVSYPKKRHPEHVALDIESLVQVTQKVTLHTAYVIPFTRPCPFRSIQAYICPSPKAFSFISCMVAELRLFFCKSADLFSLQLLSMFIVLFCPGYCFLLSCLS